MYFTFQNMNRSNKEKRFFNRFKQMAIRFAQDPGTVNNLITQAKEKAAHHRNELKEGWNSLQTFTRLVKAWVTGKYKLASYQMIISVLAALLYFLTPLDAFPDILPGGFIDDLTIIGWVIASFKGEIDRFKEWESKMIDNT